jgi:hypothetical protein
MKTGQNRNPQENLFPEKQVRAERKDFSALDANCENQVGNGSGSCFSRLWIFAIIFVDSFRGCVERGRLIGTSEPGSTR